MIEPDCEFCAELNALAGSRSLFHGTSRITLSSGEIRVFPSLGEMLPGHLLISPTYHVTSSLSIASTDLPDLRKSIEIVRRTFEAAFNEKPMFFEHGDPSGNEIAYGQCVSHAHIHVLPQAVDMLSTVQKERELLGASKLGEPNPSIKAPYVMASQDGEVAHFFSAKGAPRQYLRKLYSTLIGKPNAWEWYASANIDTTIASARRYRRMLQDVSAGSPDTAK